MKQIFISSVMKDFVTERAAAKASVESLRQKPIMAEDFGAKPYSSKAACIHGVRQSDIYLAVLGRRYGFLTEAGVSVTEEEFNEAQKRGLPTLVFVQRGELEPQQQEFFRRIGKYEDGLYVDFFDTPAELQTKATKALYDYIGQPGVAVLKVSEAANHAAQYVPKGQNSYATNLGVIMFPARQGETYLSPIEMSRAEFRERIMQLALFGAGAIFRPSLATSPVDATEHFGFVQGTEQDPVNSIDFHKDGTLVWDSAIQNGSGRDFSLVRMFVIDQAEVERQLARFIAFSALYYKELEASPHLSSFFVTVVMRGIQQKRFGRHPSVEPQGGMSMAMNNIADPLLIPKQPQMVARSELGDPTKLAGNLITLIERTFKAHDRLYTS